jgi:hypothetical protein
MGGLQGEDQARNQRDMQIRSEIAALKDSFSKEYDLFKGQQSTITEKITEMMKMEIQARLNSDM